MSKQEMIERVEYLKKVRFCEEMADFMNWSNYRKLTAEINELEKQIEALS